MMASMRRLLLITLLFSASQVAALWDPLFEMNGRGGGVQQGEGAVLWAPVVQDSGSNAFGQVGGGYFHDMWAGSVGGGYRRYAQPWLAFGVNGFIDAARSSLDTTYTQGGFGLEAFGPIWEARLNTYFPVNRRIFARQTPFDLFVLNGVNLLRENRLLEEFEQPYKGFDGEVGAFVRVFGGEAWGYAGGYYFTAPGAPQVIGPRARFEYRKRLSFACSELVIGYEYTHDQVNHHGSTGRIRWNIPLVFLGQKSNRCAPQSSLKRRLGEPVRRQPAIWTQRTIRVRGSGTERVMGLFFVDNVGGGIGTQEDPMNVVQVTGPGGAMAGDTIIFLASQGLINVDPSGPPFPLKDSQILAGFGAGNTIAIPVTGGGTYIINSIVPIPGRGTATSLGGGAVIGLANTNNIFGIGVDGGSNGISGTGLTDVRINDVDFDRLTTNGVLLTNQAGNITVTNSTFVDVLAGAGRAIQVTNTNTSATLAINNNQIGSTGAPATFGGVEVVGSGTSAITGTISNNSITNSGSDQPINIQKNGVGGSFTLDIQENTIAGVATVNQAIRVGSANTSSAWTMNLNLSRNMLSNVDDFGILIDANANTGAGPANLTAIIQSNMIGPGGNNSGGDSAIEVRGDTQAGSSINLLIDQNSIISFAGRAVEVINQDNPTICARITNNSNSGLPASTTEDWSIRNLVNGQPGIICLTLTGNTTDRTASPQNIELQNQTGDTLCVTSLATLGADNPRTDATPSTVNLVGNNVAGIIDSTIAPCPGACTMCPPP